MTTHSFKIIFFTFIFLFISTITGFFFSVEVYMIMTGIALTILVVQVMVSLIIPIFKDLYKVALKLDKEAIKVQE